MKKTVLIILSIAAVVAGGCWNRQAETANNKTADEQDCISIYSEAFPDEITTWQDDIDPSDFHHKEKPTPKGIFDLREEPVAVKVKTEEYNKMERPYVGAWLMITMTDVGYVVYNYPQWEGDEGHTPEVINVLDNYNILTHKSWNNELLEDTVFDTVWIYAKDGSFYFKCDNFLYSFKWIDKDKHIAQWTQYDKNKKILQQENYVNKKHNKFPVIMYDWD